jgi:hypothetical protein
MKILSTAMTGLKVAAKFVYRHKRVILTAVGTAGTVLAVVDAVKTAPKIKEAIEVEEEAKIVDCKAKGIPEEKQHLTPVEKGKVFMTNGGWHIVVLGAVGVCSFLLNTRFDMKEIASTGSDLLKARRDYQDLVELHNDYVRATHERLGEEKAKEIGDSVREERAKSYPEMMHVKNTGTGDTLFVDSFSGQFFRGSATFLQNQALDFGDAIKDGETECEHEGTWNEWAERIHINPIGGIYCDVPSYGFYRSSGRHGDRIGWNSTNNRFRLKILNEWTPGPGGEPAQIVSYENDPEML